MTDRGCFAMPSTFSKTSTACGACASQVSCGEKVLATLKLIRDKVKVEHLIAQLSTGESIQSLTLAQRTMIASMPVKVGPRLESMLLSGFASTVRSRFANRENAFSTSGVKHLPLVGDLLLKGGFTKTELRRRLRQEFPWSEGTAFVEVARTLALLRGLGLTVEVGRRIVLAD